MQPLVPQSAQAANDTYKLPHKLFDARCKACWLVLGVVGVPYTDEQINKAVEDVKGKTELEALVAYLQVLGLALK